MKHFDTWIDVLISCFCHESVSIVTYNSFSAIQQVRARAQPIKPRPCARLRPSRCPAAAAANTTVNHQPHGDHTPAIHTYHHHHLLLQPQPTFATPHSLPTCHCCCRRHRAIVPVTSIPPLGACIHGGWAHPPRGVGQSCA